MLARVTDPRGRLLATMINYACHPTTLAWDNTLISPDYIGALREVVEFYDRRLRIGYSEREKQDLVNFLRVL